MTAVGGSRAEARRIHGDLQRREGECSSAVRTAEIALSIAQAIGSRNVADVIRKHFADRQDPNHGVSRRKGLPR